MLKGTYVADPMSREDIYRVARAVRSLSKQRGDCFDVARFLENELCLLDTDFYLQVIEDRELGVKHAETFPEDHTIKVAQSVYNGAVAGCGRDRGTLAHEIGHYLLHDNSTVRLARTIDDIPTYQDPEWQAKVFQSELLAPHDRIWGMSPIAVANRFGISAMAAEVQLKYAKRAQTGI